MNTAGLVLDNGMTMTRDYDAGLDRLRAVVNRGPDGRVLSSFAYEHNALDQRVAVARHPEGKSAAYGFDRYGQLTNAVADFGYPGVFTTNVYAYDPIGNRRVAAKDREREVYFSNQLNQYTRIDEGVAETMPAYDAAGNLTNDGARACYWDAENRLSGVEPLAPTTGAVRVWFAYDYLGRRVRKFVDRWTGSAWNETSTRGFVYDGWNLAREFDIAAQQPATNWYCWGMDVSGTLQGAGGVGGLLAVTQDDGMYFPLYDGNGNVCELVDGSGTNVVAAYEYGPFGEVLRATGPEAAENPWRFSTRYTDQETGLVMYPKRPYSPTLGRWLVRDPAGEHMSENLYAFVGNAPVTRIDPFGLWGTDVHYEATKRWGLESGYPSQAAEMIGKADEAVDSGGTSFLPIIGDQRYHFDRNRGKGKDSRMELYEEHLKAAKAACTKPTDDPETAARELGTALHPYQDWVAHGEYGLYDDGDVYTVHNKHSPQQPKWGDVTGYPDNVGLDAVGGKDGRPAGLALQTVIVNLGVSVREYAIYEPGTKRIRLTKKMTTDSLNEFKQYLKQNAIPDCRCCQYFGVK